MTIAAGFVTGEGIVISADSLYKTGDIKVLRPKLFPYNDSPHCKVIFSSAGGALFAESRIQSCIEKIASSDPSSVNNTRGLLAVIREVLNEEWPRLLGDNPDRAYGADFQLLFALWTEENGIGGLYSSYQTAIVKKTKYECLGAGMILGHHLINSMFRSVLGISGLLLPRRM